MSTSNEVEAGAALYAATRTQARAEIKETFPGSSIPNRPEADLGPGGYHPTEYLIKKADELGSALDLDTEGFEAVVKGFHDEFDDPAYAEVFGVSANTRINYAIPFWCCFAARQLRTIVEGFMECGELGSKYQHALDEIIETYYFLAWAERYPESARLFTETHAKRVADCTDLWNLMVGSRLLFKLFHLRPPNTTAASRLTPATLEALEKRLADSVTKCKGTPDTPGTLPKTVYDLYDSSVEPVLQFIRETEPDGNWGDYSGQLACAWEYCEHSRKGHGDKTGVKFFRCSRCKALHYCSAKCQKLAYAKHKRLCFESTIADVKLSAPATQDP